MRLTCKEVTRLVSQGLDKDLGAAEQLRLQAHFALCRGCQNVRDQFAFLRRAVRRLGSGEGSGKP